MKLSLAYQLRRGHLGLALLNLETDSVFGEVFH